MANKPVRKTFSEKMYVFINKNFITSNIKVLREANVYIKFELIMLFKIAYLSF